ncbi:MAG: single-stranded DNA-binding protein, partial [Eubacteriales bacterium]
HMENTANIIHLRGNLAELPTFSHENHGRTFYTFPLEVPRLSGASDILPVIAPWDTLGHMDVFGGQRLEITGQVRSFNSRSETGRKLIISVYGETVTTTDLEPTNQVQLTGVVCKAPIYRRTPLGREICDVMLAVNRPYRRTDYLPCILWGKTAHAMADLDVGATILLEGRLQSRNYIKVIDGESIQRTAYEVSAMSASVVLHEKEDENLEE